MSKRPELQVLIGGKDSTLPSICFQQKIQDPDKLANLHLTSSARALEQLRANYQPPNNLRKILPEPETPTIA